MTFGDNVRRYRRFRGMTQAELAVQLGYKNKASIGKIENGDSDLPLSMAQKIADVLRVDIMVLTHGDSATDNTQAMLSEKEQFIIDAYRANSNFKAGVDSLVVALNIEKKSEDNGTSSKRA